MVAGCPAVEEDTIRNIDVALQVALLVVRIDYRFIIRWALLTVIPDVAMKTCTKLFCPLLAVPHANKDTPVV